MNVHRDERGVWRTIGRRDGVRMVLVGPAYEARGVVLVPGRAVDQWNAGHLIYHDLLQAIQSVLLHGGIDGAGVLREELVGRGIVPPLEIRRGLLADGRRVGAIEQGVVQVVGCWPWRGP